MSSSRVTLLGGLNEIGGNKFLLEEDGERLLLDFGMSFGARGRYFAEFLSPRTNTVLTDLLELGLLPDVDGLYRDDLVELAVEDLDRDPPESAKAYEERTGEPFVHGVLVTHAHLDHFGDLTFLDPDIPVYVTATTRAMLDAIHELTRSDVESEIVEVRERALDELASGYFPGDLKVGTSTRERRIEVCPEGGWFQVGPFRAQAIPVDHSVPGACGFLVETPAGKRVFYTGDVRFHGRLTDRTKRLREAADGLAPNLLLTEGTRVADTEGSEHEARVEEEITDLVEGCEGLAIAEFGWKDTTRFDTLQRVAERTGRTLLVDPRLAFLLRRLQHRSDVPSKSPEGYDHVQVYLRRRRTMRYRAADYRYSKHEAGYLSDWDKDTIKAAWKSQDEVTLRDPLAHWRDGVRAEDVREAPERYLLHLSFYQVQELVDLQPPDGSRWIRCLTEPFSDEMELDIDRQRAWMERFGLEHNLPETPKGPAGTLADRTTHVSGHAGRDSLFELVEAIDAERVVPIHTEHPEAFGDIVDDPVLFDGMDHADAAAGKAVVEF